MRGRKTNYSICPYYRYERPQSIYCAGVVDGQTVKINFSEKEKRKKWSEAFCKDKCKDCPYYLD